MQSNRNGFRASMTWWARFLCLAFFVVPTAVTGQAPDLNTVELVGTPELQRFNGVAELRPAMSPFTTAVTATGVHRYDVIIKADSLPEPRSLGNFTTFVVWAAPPTMRPMQKLGELRAGVVLAAIAFNRFTIFVTAEADVNVEEPSGVYVMRGTSPSMRLSAAHAP